MTNVPDWQAIDRAHVWHPYSAVGADLPIFPVVGADGVHLKLADGRELIDGMSSWWCAIHGYNVDAINRAASEQIQAMAHVMFGGLTHQPAVQLASRLVELTPAGLDKVFFCDSGSVAVEVAMKMALQFAQAEGRPDRHRFLSFRGGYHGDTFGAMSVCDPVTGMHRLFQRSLNQQVFVERPARRFGEPCTDSDIDELLATIERYADELAGVIVEPIVQGAGGMWFYAAEYLNAIRAACERHGILMLADEIATGFGRTGKLFACEHAGVSPDIMCLGKALTGGYLSLAATLTTSRVADTIANGDPGLFMHGPTFMANPLACRIAAASIDLLLASDWQERIAAIERGLQEGLAPCRKLPGVVDVRSLGAIGVVETRQPLDMRLAPGLFVEAGVWVRPFGRLVYLMPPFVIDDDSLRELTQAVFSVTATLGQN